jgi:Arc/MetJ-type ribon-helix-helix transcriptional regulator
MAQLNLNLTPEFASTLERFMRLRNFHTKSEAIRTAVEEGLERAARPRSRTSFRSLRGLGLCAPLNPEPRFPTDDSLWE